MNAVPVFEVRQSRANLQWYFQLKAPNNEIICDFESRGTRG